MIKGISAFSLLALAFLATPGAAALDWHDPHAVAAAAVASSPDLAALTAQKRGSVQRTMEAGSLPNPMAMGGVQNQQADLTIDDQMTMYWVGASQTLVRPSKRRAARAKAEIECDRVDLEMASIKAEVEREALFAWYEIAAADSRIEAAKRVRALAELTSQAATSRYETGTSSQAELIRTTLEIANLDHTILTFKGQRRQAASRLLPLLGLPLATEIPRLQIAHDTVARGLPEVVDVADDHPALAAARLESESADQDVLLARLAYKPDWNIEASYGVRPTEKDMVSVTGKIEIPFRRKTLIEPRIREAQARRDASIQRVESVRRRLLQDLGRAMAAHDEASDQLELHENKLVPMARTGYESALGAYQSGKGSVQEVMEAASASLRLEIDFYDFMLQHIEAITDFEAIQKGARQGAIGGQGSPGGMGASSAGASAAPSMEEGK